MNRSKNPQKSKISLLPLLLVGVILLAVIMGFRNFVLEQEFQKYTTSSYQENIPNHVKTLRSLFPEAKYIFAKNQYTQYDEARATIELSPELTIGHTTNGSEADFFGVRSIVTDSSGNIFVNEYGKGEIQVFDRRGKYLSTFSRKGSGPGELGDFVILYFDSNDTLHVYDYSNQRLSQFDTKGNFLISFRLTTPRLPSSFAVDNEGHYYLSYYDFNSKNVIHKFNHRGRLLRSFGTPIEHTIASDVLRLNFAQNWYPGVLACSDTTLYYSQRNPYQINKFNLEGKLRLFVYRENEFMSPPSAVIVKGAYGVGATVQSTLIAVWSDLIINCVSVPTELPTVKNPPEFGTIIDVYHRDGSLIQSFQLAESFWASSMDGKGRIYGVVNSPDHDEYIAVYRLKRS